VASVRLSVSRAEGYCDKGLIGREGGLGGETVDEITNNVSSMPAFRHASSMGLEIPSIVLPASRKRAPAQPQRLG
jgi:hypothetical protein